MTLKVIRYKNYGCQMTSEDNKDKFYFSFYELSNGKIIELMLFQADNEGVIIDQYEFSYTKIKLKSGEIRNYKFGNSKASDVEGMSKEFFKWFDSSPPAVDVVNWLTLYDEEEKCVKDFYIENVEPIKHIKTDTTEVKP
tara:strand:+ start:165 stop:581 length:417 start_codon:yes stop_codon:yes gene_type:complete